jgi:hypothetical protein
LAPDPLSLPNALLFPPILSGVAMRLSRFFLPILKENPKEA